MPNHPSSSNQATQPNPSAPQLSKPRPTPASNKIPTDATAQVSNTIGSLPEVPEDLKLHISTYVQRAVELAAKDPIMSYWCLFFAAKQGIAIGNKESRPYLFSLMEMLDKIKRDLKDHEAVATDEAGSVYIEEFALKVYSSADGEDKSGGSTRSTAKKFLAAANFLELLSIFDMPEQTLNQERIRYSKWKAAAIAKEFRDGGDISHTPSVLSTPTPDRSLTLQLPPTSRTASSSQVTSRRNSPPPEPTWASPHPPQVLLAVPSNNQGSSVSTGAPSPSVVSRVPLPVSPLPSRSPNLEPQTLHPAVPTAQDAKENHAPLPAAPTETRNNETGNGLLHRRQASSDDKKLFTTLAGPLQKVFSMGDGRPSPGEWSNAATPGVEDIYHRPVPNGTSTTRVAIYAQTHPARPVPVPPTVTLSTPAHVRPTPHPPPPVPASKERDGRPEPQKPEVYTNSTTATSSGGVVPMPSLSGREIDIKSAGGKSIPFPSSESGTKSRTEAAQSKSSHSRTRSMSISATLAVDSKPLSTPTTKLPPVQAIVSETVTAVVEVSSLQPNERSSLEERREDLLPVPSKIAELNKKFDPPRAPDDSQQPVPGLPLFSRITAFKKVHFTNSVKGGLSSIASISPPPSPPPVEVQDIPLPSSAESTQSSSDEKVGLDAAKDWVFVPQNPNPSMKRDSTQTSGNRTPQPNSVFLPALEPRIGSNHTSTTTYASSKVPTDSTARTSLSSGVLSPAASQSSSSSIPSVRERSNSVAHIPTPSTSSLPVPTSFSQGHSKSQSLGHASSVGSVGSLTTVAGKVSPKPTTVSLPSSALSPRDGPNPVPPVSMTLPSVPPNNPSPAAAYAVNSMGNPTAVSQQSPSNPPVDRDRRPSVTYPPTPYPRPSASLVPAPEDMLLARKHTKYAMSALEFDDVETARRELRLALASLGPDPAS